MNWWDSLASSGSTHREWHSPIFIADMELCSFLCAKLINFCCLFGKLRCSHLNPRPYRHDALICIFMVHKGTNCIKLVQTMDNKSYIAAIESLKWRKLSTSSKINTIINRTNVQWRCQASNGVIGTLCFVPMTLNGKQGDVNIAQASFEGVYRFPRWWCFHLKLFTARKCCKEIKSANKNKRSFLALQLSL